MVKQSIQYSLEVMLADIENITNTQYLKLKITIVLILILTFLDIKTQYELHELLYQSPWI